MSFRFIPYIAIVLAFIGLALVYTGLHSIDNAWNLRYINKVGCDYNITFSDISTIGIEISATDLYNVGVLQVMGGVFMMILGLTAFAYYEPRRNRHGA